MDETRVFRLGARVLSLSSSSMPWPVFSVRSTTTMSGLVRSTSPRASATSAASPQTSRSGSRPMTSASRGGPADGRRPAGPGISCRAVVKVAFSGHVDVPCEEADVARDGPERRCCGLPSPWQRGAQMLTRVPRPGAVSTSSRPPISSRRSRMLNRPKSGRGCSVSSSRRPWPSRRLGRRPSCGLRRRARRPSPPGRGPSRRV